MELVVHVQCTLFAIKVFVGYIDASNNISCFEGKKR